MKHLTLPLAVSIVLSLPVAPTIADTLGGQFNRLRGIVVSSVDGRPLPGVQVVMAHDEKGHLRIGPRGSLDGSGDEDERPQDFARRNARLFCDAFTDDQGLFTLTSFASPSARWNLAAGDYQHGICVRSGIVPADFADRPLRIEIDPPAFITVRRLPDPPDTSFRASVDLAIADVHADGTATVRKSDESDAPQSGVQICSWPEKPDEPV